MINLRLVIYLLLFCAQITLARGVLAEPQALQELYEEHHENAKAVVKLYSDGKGKYQIVISTKKHTPIIFPVEQSFPPPRIAWLSDDLLKIDFGSALGADMHSMFYSLSRHQTSGPFDFVKAVDSTHEVILCASEDIYLQKIFMPNGKNKTTIRLDKISTAALKWFALGEGSKFYGDKVQINYLTSSIDNGGKEEWETESFPIPPFLLNNSFAK